MLLRNVTSGQPKEHLGAGGNISAHGATLGHSGNIREHFCNVRAQKI